MKKFTIDRLMKGVFFSILAVAMTLSGWSLTTLGMSYGMPKGFAILISIAIDGAGIHAGYRASTYAKTRFSGIKSKMLAYAVVLTSAGLNANHALMLGYGVPGAVLFASPAGLLGFMLDSELGWMDKEEKTNQGHILERLPVFGRLSWVLFPSKTFKALKTVVKTRLSNAVDNFGQKTDVQTSIQTVSVDSSQERLLVSEQQTKRKTSKKNELPNWMPSDATMSVNKLSKVCYDNGVREIDEVLKLAKQVKNIEVTRASVQKGLSRARNTAVGTNGYL